jgi:hypothetical protein
MVLVVRPEALQTVKKALEVVGEAVFRIGEIVARSESSDYVQFRN